MRHALPVCALLLGHLTLLLMQPAFAEQWVDQGDLRVHYNAMNSTSLTPEIAHQAGTTRSREQAVLVLSPQQRQVDGRYLSVVAIGTASATSLLGQRQTISLLPVREGDAFYLLGNFGVIDGEFLRLDAEILPEGASAPLKLQFTQQFFRD